MIARLLRLNNACNVGVCEFHGEGEYRVVDAGHEVVHARKSIDALSHRANRRVSLPTCPNRGFCHVFGPHANDRRGRDDAPKTDFNCLKVVMSGRNEPRGKAVLGSLSRHDDRGGQDYQNEGDFRHPRK